MAEQLKGAELLTKVRELDGISKSELVRQCGYVSIKKDGAERLNYTAFYEALLEAKGMTLGEGSRAPGHPGRKLSYQATTQFNGNLLVGKAYTALLGIKPGDPFEIRFGRNGRIILVPINESNAEDGADAGEGEGDGEATAPAASSGNGSAKPEAAAAAPVAAAAAPAAKEIPGAW